MLTFLELYQTLLGFVFFKLYTDAGLVYPPPLDAKKDDGAAGVGAFSLQEMANKLTRNIPETKEGQVVHGTVSAKDVRQTIKVISSIVPSDGGLVAIEDKPTPDVMEEDFIAHPSKTSSGEVASLLTFQSLSNQQPSEHTNLFAPYTFWLSRETSRPIFEFIVRSFGGRIGWPASSGSGSSFDESDDSITHVIIDRPAVDRPDETETERERRRGRKYVQPQWVVDCINAEKILLEEPYAQGKPLPPHLSPFGDLEGAYDPTANHDQVNASDDEEDAEMETPRTEEKNASVLRNAVLAAAPEDLEALRAAELSAEVAGVDAGVFEQEVSKSLNKSRKTTAAPTANEGDQEMNKMLMSNKKRKLYERMRYGEKKKTSEVCPSSYNDTCAVR
jgi:pescadillo